MTQTHRIKRQTLELDLPREEGAFALQQKAGRAFQERVLPELDRIFSQLVPPGVLLRVDRMDIDLGLIPTADWEHFFVEQCVQQIGVHLKKANDEAYFGPGLTGVHIQTETVLYWEIFYFFLQNGVFPWQGKGITIAQLEAVLTNELAQQNATVNRELLPLFKQNPSVLKRLFSQFSSTFFEKVVETALELPQGWIQKVLNQLVIQWQAQQQWVRLRTGPTKSNQPHGRKLTGTLYSTQSNEKKMTGTTLSQHQRFVFFQLILDASERSCLPVVPDKTWIQNIGQALLLFEKSRISGSLNTVQTPQNNTILHPEGIPVEIAGLVIFAPYLAFFIKKLEYQMDQEYDQQRALYLLYFLATGKDNPEEPQLAIPKILCGIPLDTPVDRLIMDAKPLTDGEKEEARQLSEAVIRNWTVLKNTSVEGLQSGFIQRDGLIYTNNDSHFRLCMERKGQDVLLDTLPWTISMIKLPWMQGILNVEW